MNLSFNQFLAEFHQTQWWDFFGGSVGGQHVSMRRRYKTLLEGEQVHAATSFKIHS